MSAPLVSPEMAAAIERAEGVEEKAVIWRAVLAAADSKSRLGVAESALIGSVIVNLILIAALAAAFVAAH